MKTLTKTVLSLVVVVVASGCAMAQVAPDGTGSGVAAAEVWANTCTRCHAVRSPATLSDAQWDTAVQHMRLRANLPAADARAIATFLKASN